MLYGKQLIIFQDSVPSLRNCWGQTVTATSLQHWSPAVQSICHKWSPLPPPPSFCCCCFCFLYEIKFSLCRGNLIDNFYKFCWWQLTWFFYTCVHCLVKQKTRNISRKWLLLIVIHLLIKSYTSLELICTKLHDWFIVHMV